MTSVAQRVNPLNCYPVGTLVNYTIIIQQLYTKYIVIVGLAYQ